MDSLYTLSSEYLQLMELSEDPTVDPDTLADTFEALSGEIEAKAVNCAYVLNRISADKSTIKAEIDRLTAIYNTKDRAEKRIKDLLLMAMQLLSIKKIGVDPRFNIIRKKNGGKAPLIITGEVPQSCMRIIYEPDKELIRKKLEAGEELEFAHLGERGEHVEVK